MKKFVYSVICVLSLIALSGCETDNDKQLASAQSCLDRATSSTVQTCMDKVSGDNSAQASLIRCSGLFLQNGMTTSKLVSSLTNLQTNSGGSNAMLGMLGVFAITSSTAADNIVRECTASRQKGITMFANMVKIASVMTIADGTLTTIVNGGGTPTQAQMAAALASLSSGTSDAALGTAAVAISQTYCVGANSTNDICTRFNAANAGGGGSAAAVGAYLRQNVLPNP